MKLEFHKRYIGLYIFALVLPLPIPLIYSAIALGLMLLNLIFLGDFKKINIKNWTVLCILFVLIDGIRSLFFEQSFKGIDSVKLAFLIVPLAFQITKIESPKVYRKLLQLFTIGVGVYIFYAIGYLFYFYIKYAKWYTFSFTDHYVIYVLYNYLPGAYHHTYIGLYIAFALVILMDEVKRSFKRSVKVILTILLFLFFLMQFYVGSKMTMILSFFGLLFYLLISGLNRKSFYQLLGGSIVLFLGFVFLIKDWLILSITNSVAHRLIYTKKSLELIKENFWFGIGGNHIKDYQLLIDDNIKPLIPHNLYIHELLANGILGLILILIMLGFLLRKSFTTNNFILATLTVICILLSLTEDFLYLQRGVFFFVFFTSLLLSNKLNYKEK
ncbi:O-antigen ligase family protein [Pseudofulvibacter geojedonensis]|uniref:O-antigen ligase family protein n=1 Tax=Pseudofulvibacter geojedonensis TaxID=1123758 RepID=A0ABW3I4N9_9FLAO